MYYVLIYMHSQILSLDITYLVYEDCLRFLKNLLE